MRVPQTVGWLARRARESLDPLAARRAQAAAGVPVPPRRLRSRTGAPGAREFAFGGARAADELAVCLPRPLAAYRSILDFGCGSARVLPHVAARAPQAKCTGCDVDAAAIAWASAHHPQLNFALSGFEPPLPFADRSFELVYSISVLSHLDEPLADRWLAELARVMAPGATALLSVHGNHALQQFRIGRARTSWCPAGTFARGPLAEGEFAYVPYVRSRWNRGELPGIGGSFGLAFHSERYLREHWSRWLVVEQIVPRALTGWQDVVVCRRPG